MSTPNRSLQAAFERHFQTRIEKAKAITPGQKKELIEKLRQELSVQGRIPIATGPVKVDPKHPFVRAALEGRSVTMGGKVISQKGDQSLSSRMQALPVPAKIAVMAAIFLIPLLFIGLVIFARAGEPEEVAIIPTVTATQAVEPTQTASPSPTLPPNVTVTMTPIPTLTAVVIEISPTPYAFALTEGDAPNSNNDPASIEVAGFSYILGAGKVNNGAWQPAGAEWLTGSYLRRIIGLPYDPNLANVLTQIRPGNVIKLRLRSGEIVKYKIAQTLRVGRQQIEVLAERSPSLAVILYGEPSPERTVVIANAVQEPSDFTIYSQGIPSQDSPIIINGTPKPEPALPTLAPTTQQTIITNTRTMTNTFAGLTLAVGECNQADRIGEQEPPSKKQKYYVCDITVTALPNSAGSFYSQEMIGIADENEINSTIDWVPPALPAISEALGNGSLDAGQSRGGRIAGLIKTDDPVLVWLQAGMRIIMQLE